MFKRHGAIIKFNKNNEMTLTGKLSNNELACLIRLAAKWILKNEDTKFTVEQVLSGLSMNLDYQQIYNHCKFCKDGYPTMTYQGFDFCPHCGSKLYKDKL